jgi:predicted double-glycine peptidase
MGVDLSSKVGVPATLTRATEAITQSQKQVAQAIETQNPAAITSAMTDASSQVAQALQNDSFQAASTAQAAAQSAWSASFAASAPSLTGTSATSSPTAVGQTPASIPATRFSAQQLADIGKKVGDSYAAGDIPPPQFTTQQLKDIGKKVGNSINESNNVVSDDDYKKSGFSKNSDVVQQATDTDCGAAAVATLTSSKTDKPSASSKDVMDDLSTHFSSAAGTTPKQLAGMLAHEGLEVTHSEDSLDHDALSSTLKDGGKGLALVDSNAINPKSKSQEPGKAHWVAIDGMDKSGNYQVKDPASGRSYYVSPDQLEKAMSTVRGTSNSGGLLTVRNTQGTQSETELAQKGEESASKLGDAPGTGSNWRKSFGAESA